MLDELKRILLTGLGGVVLTRDKLEEWKNRLVKENKMTEKEAKSLFDEMMETGQAQWKDFEKTFREMLRKRLDSMKVADSDELERLRARVDSLELRVSTLERVSTLPPKMP